MAFFNQNRNNSDNKNKNLIIISSNDDIDVRKIFNTFEGFYKKENRKNNNIDQINKYYKNIKNNKGDINKKIPSEQNSKLENIKKFDNEIQKKILMLRICYYFNEALLKLWYYAKIMT